MITLTYQTEAGGATFIRQEDGLKFICCEDQAKRRTAVFNGVFARLTGDGKGSCEADMVAFDDDSVFKFFACWVGDEPEMLNEVNHIPNAIVHASDKNQAVTRYMNHYHLDSDKDLKCVEVVVKNVVALENAEKQVVSPSPEEIEVARLFVEQSVNRRNRQEHVDAYHCEEFYWKWGVPEVPGLYLFGGHDKLAPALIESVIIVEGEENDEGWWVAVGPMPVCVIQNDEE